MPDSLKTCQTDLIIFILNAFTDNIIQKFILNNEIKILGSELINYQTIIRDI